MLLSLKLIALQQYTVGMDISHYNITTALRLARQSQSRQYLESVEINDPSIFREFFSMINRFTIRINIIAQSVHIVQFMNLFISI